MEWVTKQAAIDCRVADPHRIAPLGDKRPDDLRVAFSNSMYKCFVFEEGILIGAGRAVADGVDGLHPCDIVVHPGFQGRGIGREIIVRPRDMSAGQRKIMLYANPGKKGLYRKLGFRLIRTPMAIFKDEARAIRIGLVEGD